MSIKQKRILWPFLIIISFAVTAFVFAGTRRAEESHARIESRAVPAVNPLPAQKNRVRSSLEVELISIEPQGFQPRQITPAKGHFVMMVENHSGLEDLELRLDQSGGPRLRDVRHPRGQREWSDEVDLAPGHYTLTEAGHPGWACDINVTGR